MVCQNADIRPSTLALTTALSNESDTSSTIRMAQTVRAEAPPAKDPSRSNPYRKAAASPMAVRANDQPKVLAINVFPLGWGKQNGNCLERSAWQGRAASA